MEGLLKSIRVLNNLKPRIVFKES